MPNPFWTGALIDHLVCWQIILNILTGKLVRVLTTMMKTNEGHARHAMSKVLNSRPIWSREGNCLAFQKYDVAGATMQVDVIIDTGSPCACGLS